MSKIIGALLLVALAVRLVVLFFFKRNIVLNEISLVLFIAVFVVAVIVMLQSGGNGELNNLYHRVAGLFYYHASLLFWIYNREKL